MVIRCRAQATTTQLFPFVPVPSVSHACSPIYLDHLPFSLSVYSNNFVPWLLFPHKSLLLPLYPNLVFLIGLTSQSSSSPWDLARVYSLKCLSFSPPLYVRFHRIMESFRLEMTIKSSHYPNTAKSTAEPCP